MPESEMPNSFAEAGAVESRIERLNSIEGLKGHSSSLTTSSLIDDGDVVTTSVEAPAIPGSTVLQDRWHVALRTMSENVDAHLFEAYLSGLICESISEDEEAQLTVACSSAFVRNHIERNFLELIRASAEKALSRRVARVSVTIASPEQRANSPKSGAVIAPRRALVVKRMPMAGSPVRKSTDLSSAVAASGLNPRYTFSSFVVGNSNQFCHAAAMRVAERPGCSYNPLFIYGGVGLGKTHILHAIGNAVLEQRPTARVMYMSSETFTNELIQALRNAKMEEFKRKMRSIEVLLIDDIQFMCGKERTQEEFFHTFNTLYNAKHQIVLTSDKIPQDIPGIEERLQTRFSWGLTADLQAPDFETRVAILRRKASIDGFLLPEEVAHFVAQKISSNVRELEGALTRIHAVSSLQKVPLTVEVAHSALKPILQPKPTTISVDEIKRVVANRFGVKVSDIVSKRRTKNLSFPRHIAMYLCRKHTTCSYPEIGSHFGNRDHSSVIHAASVVSTKIGHDQSLRDLISGLERELFDG